MESTKLSSKGQVVLPSSIRTARKWRPGMRLAVEDRPEGVLLRARVLLEACSVLVVPTVLLEAEWVLRGAYRIERSAIAGSLRRLLGLRNVEVAKAQAVAEALGWFEAGLDFADALHLALAEGAEAMVTFDARLAKRARRITSRDIRAL